MSNLNATGGGLRYRGTNAPQPPNCNFHPRDPNEFDRFGYSLLDMWLNTETEVVWFLATLQGTALTGGIRAHWVTWGGPSAVGVLFTQGNDNVSVFPDISGKINIIGVDPLFVAASGANTEQITVATATTSQIGVTTLATNAQTIAGTDSTHVNTPTSLKAKLGTQIQFGVPYGNTTSQPLGWTFAGDDGQVLIGATGSSPAFSTITSGDSSITFVAGPNSLDMRAAVAGGSSIKTTVYDTPGTYAFTKDALTKKIEIWGWAGGGGGSSLGQAGSTGGAFHYSFPAFFVDDGPTTIEVVVGAGGAGGTPGSTNGIAGGPSWFGNFTTGNNTSTGVDATVGFSTSGPVITEGGPSFPGDFSSAALMTRIVGTNGTIMGWFSGSTGGSVPANDGATGGTGTISNFLGTMLGGNGGGGGLTQGVVPVGPGGDGGAIRNRRTLATIVAGGAGGAIGVAGSAGNPTFLTGPQHAPTGFNFLSAGTGGGGGGRNANGAAGGFPAGGGGGAGLSNTGTAVANGGAGADGLVIVMEFLSD